MEYGCIGEKLVHSFSRVIHNELCDYKYELKEVPKDELDSFMKKADFKAINVTIPYKQDVIPYLDEISDIAKDIGAVNTIVNKNGKLIGYNTDFFGMKDLINFAGIKIEGKKVLILGSGGTSKTALAVAKSMKAKEVYRVSRKGGGELISYNDAEIFHSDAEIIINTTPCGMYPNIGVSAIDINKFPQLSGIIDAVYNPLCSKLIVDAKLKGITAIGGLYMLVSQAVSAAERFTDKKIAPSETQRIFKKLLNEKQNIVLIGMPSSGKTTVGKELAKSLSKEFVDTDALITERYGEITEIFKSDGESGFRKIESEIIFETAKKQSAIIATGGGAVLNRKNIELLKENGIIIFIDRPLELLITSSDRPLSSDSESLKKRYNERYDIYCNSADFIIKGDGSVEENKNRILEVIK